MGKIIKWHLKLLVSCRKSLICTIFASSIFSNLSVSAQLNYDEQNVIRQKAINNLYEQLNGWEWLVLEKDDAETRSESYPTKFEYYFFQSHPNYRICWNKFTQSYSIFNTDGTLNRISWLVNGTISFDEMSSYRKQEVLELKKRKYYELINYYLAKCEKLFYEKLKPLAESKYRIQSIKGGSNEFQIYKNKKNVGLGIARGLLSGRLYDDASSYTSELKLEDEDFFNWLINNANLDTTFIKINLKVENLDKKGKKKSIVLQYNITPTEEFIALQSKENNNTFEITDVPYTCDINSWSYVVTNGIVKECKKVLLNNLIAIDYQSNKYNVQNESASVQQEIEMRLGLRERLNSQIANNADIVLIKRVCKRMGITYKAGMSKQQVTAAIKKKNPQLSDYEIGMKMYSILQDETQRMIGEGLMLSAITSNNSEKERANDYIEQLKKDHNDDINIVNCSRVDDVTFDIHYSCNHVIRVKFYSSKPYECSYNITLQE